MSATTMCSSILWMLALGGPSSITWGQIWAMKRPSLVPPVVESSVVSPVSAAMACCTAPTSWQISNVHGGTGATNVIPGEVVVDFNFRFSTESTAEGLQQRVHAVLDRHGLEYALRWTLGGLPFLTTPGELVGAVQQAIAAETGLTTELSTTGGTSDGRFIAQVCPQVIELGPPNASIHKIDEHIVVADIEPLKNIYRRTLENLHAQALATEEVPA